jgi:hypothetical protein
VFEDMAFGRFPSPTYFQKDYLCCGIKGKEFVYRVFENQRIVCGSVEMLYREVYHLLAHRVGLLSEKDAIRQRKDILSNKQIDYEKERFSEESWNVVRKKIIKDNVIEQFVLDMRGVYSLSLSVVKNFFSLLILGFLFKTILAKDILYEQGSIRGIQNIEFFKNKIKWNRHLYLHSSSPPSKPPPSTLPEMGTGEREALTAMEKGEDIPIAPPTKIFKVIFPKPFEKVASTSFVLPHLPTGDTYSNNQPCSFSSCWQKYLTNTSTSSIPES